MASFRRFLDPSLLARTYRDPVSWAALGIDLIPVFAVLTLGWGAVALVMLYWLENLVLGLVTLARMFATGARGGVAGVSGTLFLAAFFTFHYGMFCFVHGEFLNMFAAMSEPEHFSTDFHGPLALVNSALSAAPRMTFFVGLILAWQIFLFLWDFIRRGEFKESGPHQEMFKPYGRIIVLHFAIFAGAAAMVWLGQPMWGVLGLIVLRAVWGVVLSVNRRLRLDRVSDE